ncbi:MAG: glycoside hydrolase family 2 TIM barrel-domain containing protein [Victivallaceae bacterium]|nr:glycoside hydrolase family 2 TIM barrel-domain containing protein [Victivallaceae bacterium]
MTNQERTRKKINSSWKFYKGDQEHAFHIDFDDNNWNTVKLPHDWSIDGPFSHEHYIPAVKVANHLEARADSYLPKGIGWYRKTIRLEEQIKNKKVFIEFEGIFRDSTLWINGDKVGNHSSGYTGVVYDITPFLYKSTDNLIAVKVDSTMMEGWWYEGSGIYRNVWLIVTDKLHVANWGTFVTMHDISRQNSLAQIEVEVVNDYTESINCTLKNSIVDADGQIVLQLTSSEEINGGGNIKVVQRGNISEPKLWSLDFPYLYSVYTEIFNGETLVDSYQTPFGIREFEFTADKGFFLNGKHIRLQGGCIHHDFGGLGVALPDKANYKTVKVLKEMGCNIIRSAHNPASPALMSACDELGMLLWAEHRNLENTDIASRNLRDLIKRDRNHPSIILWGLANIAGGEDDTLTESLRYLNTIAKIEDFSRPTAVGLEANADANANGFADVTDVVGYNGGGMGIDTRDHLLFPHRKILISEFSSGRGARGIYFSEKPVDEAKKETLGDGREVFMNHSYETIYELCRSHEKEWAHIKVRPWLAGGIMWSAIEYRGETVGWPIVTSQFGVLDICRFPKDTYYFYKQEWTVEPFVHFFPHWTWPGREDENIDIWSYTNCDYIKLFVNGQQIRGRTDYLQYGSSHPHSSWEVKYEPGTILAEGYVNNKLVVSKEYKTAYHPVAVHMETLDEKIKADGEDCSFINVKVVDCNGTFNPLANNPTRITVEGPGKLIGLCSGDPKSHESPKGNEIKMFNGLLLAIVQSTGKSGTVVVKASSPNLKECILKIKTY